MPAKEPKASTIVISELDEQTIRLRVVGKTPLICNRMSQKAKRSLLAGGEIITRVQRQSRLKHDPWDEYRQSPYRLVDPKAPTFIAMMSSAFKGAMMTAALDTEGAKKTQIGRLVWVEGDYTAIYGVPEIFSSVVRSADINRTPDIRTRAIIPHWAAEVEITFARPILNAQSVGNLLGRGGKTAGIGDWRPEKGKGNYGQFKVVSKGSLEEEAWEQVVAEGGREAQLAALREPAYYDAETDELLSWFAVDVKRRGFALTPSDLDSESTEDEPDEEHNVPGLEDEEAEEAEEVRLSA